MLRIGLSGGIGAGKSTVSSAFAALGGIIVDGDVIAREVVEPGTEGLAKLVEAFGRDILHDSGPEAGSLNRPALAAVAFSDDDKRATLNGIVHPLVAHRRAAIIDAAPGDAIIVEDIPLLVESQMAPMFPLVVMVHADPEIRVARLLQYRGFTEADARARIAAQATEAERRDVADVWLENHGSADELAEQARSLWQDRILPFAQNVAEGRSVDAPSELVDYDPTWPEQAARIVARLRTACGHHARQIAHVGPTAVPRAAARDVIDIEIVVDALTTADELAGALLAAGYPKVAGHSEIAYASADPGRPTRIVFRAEVDD